MNDMKLMLSRSLGRRILASGVAAIVLYAASYVVWTRVAQYQSRLGGYPGYFFVEPFTESGEQLNAAAIAFYRPLIELDALLKTGTRPSYPPLQGLSK
jgi:hypothetical protein